MTLDPDEFVTLTDHGKALLKRSIALCNDCGAVWTIYVDTSKDVGEVDHLKVFATEEAAERWFAEHDPDGWRSSMRWRSLPRTNRLRPSSPYLSRTTPTDSEHTCPCPSRKGVLQLTQRGDCSGACSLEIATCGAPHSRFGH